MTNDIEFTKFSSIFCFAFLFSLCARGQAPAVRNALKKVEYDANLGSVLDAPRSPKQRSAAKTKEFSTGLFLYADGVGGNIRLALNDNHYGSWRLGFRSIQHEKEVKQRKGPEFREYGLLRPYVFGKINCLYELQLGYDIDVFELPLIVEGASVLTFSFSGGAVVRAEKPVYLLLLVEDSSQNRHAISASYFGSNSENYLNNSNIIGADRWMKGVSESKIHPGFYFEPALAIMLSGGGRYVTRCLVGVNFSYSIKPVQILALHRGKNFLTTFMVGISFGLKHTE